MIHFWSIFWLKLIKIWSFYVAIFKGVPGGRRVLHVNSDPLACYSAQYSLSRIQRKLALYGAFLRYLEAFWEGAEFLGFDS